MEPSPSSGQPPLQQPSVSSDLTQQSLPAAPLRFPFKTGASREGYLQLLLDDQQRPARIEVVDCNESIRTRSIAGFTVILSSPEIRQLFLPLTEIPDQAMVLRNLSRILKESLEYAERHHLASPEIIRHTGAKKTHTQHRIECGDTIEHYRSELPLSIHEWAFAHHRSTSKVVRLDASGTAAASLSTSRLCFPDGSQMREITIQDHRHPALLPAPYRYMHLSRTASDGAESDEAFLDLLMDFQQASLDTFLAPYRRYESTTQSASPRSPSSTASREPSMTEVLPGKDSRQLESGAIVRWDYAEGEGLISVSASPDNHASIVSFSPSRAPFRPKADRDTFMNTVDTLINAENPARMGAVFNSIISLFSFRIELCGDRSSRIRALTDGLLEELSISHLTTEPASRLRRQKPEIFHDIIQGHEWIRFRDSRFSEKQANQIDRIATSISFRVWQGGCNLIVFGEPDGTEISIIPGSRYFFVGNIPDTREFLREQLHIFAEDPLLLLQRHLEEGASASPVMTIESTPETLARLLLIQKLVEHDRASDSPRMPPLPLKSLVMQCWHSIPGHRLPMLTVEPFRIELEFGSSGIQHIVFNRHNTLMERLRSLLGSSTEFRIAVPPALAQNTPAIYATIKALGDELEEGKDRDLNYRISPESLIQGTGILFNEQLAQHPGSHRTESSEYEQQGSAKNMETRHPR